LCESERNNEPMTTISVGINHWPVEGFQV
jgi:hypothetical protein